MALAKLKDDLDEKQFLPMVKGKWYEVTINPYDTSNLFHWMYIPELGLNIDRRNLDMKKDD